MKEFFLKIGKNQFLKKIEKITNRFFSLLIKGISIIAISWLIWLVCIKDVNERYIIKVSNSKNLNYLFDEKVVSRHIVHDLNEINQTYTQTHDIECANVSYEEKADFSVELPITGIVLKNITNDFKTIHCHFIDTSDYIVVVIHLLKEEIKLEPIYFQSNSVSSLDSLTKKVSLEIAKRINPLALGYYFWTEKKYNKCRRVAKHLCNSRNIMLRKWGYNLLGNAEQSEKFNSGKGSRNIKDYKKAIYYYKEALKIDDSFSAAYDNIGVISIRCGDYSDAVKNLRKALELNDKNSKAYNNMAYAEGQRSNFKKGKKSAKKAISIGQKLNYQPKLIGIYQSTLAELEFLEKKTLSNDCLLLFEQAMRNQFPIEKVLYHKPYPELLLHDRFFSLIETHYSKVIIKKCHNRRNELKSVPDKI